MKLTKKSKIDKKEEDSLPVFEDEPINDEVIPLEKMDISQRDKNQVKKKAKKEECMKTIIKIAEYNKKNKTKSNYN